MSAAEPGRLLRSWPFLSGCGTLANHPWLRPRARGWAWARTRDAAWILVDREDHVGRACYLAGDLDPKITALCRRALRPGDAALDVGANLGVVAFAMAVAVGPPGRVDAFEPQPRIRAALRLAVRRNRFEHLRVHGRALGAEPGTTELHVPVGNAGMASLVRRDGDASVVPVRVEPLADFAERERLPPARLCKIDVEGSELAVLRGAAAWWRRHPPAVVICEVNAGDGSPVLEEFAGLGYRCFGLPKVLRRLALVPLGSDRGRFNDLVAIHRDAEAGLDRRLGVLGT